MFRLTLPRRPGPVLVRSPLLLERSFDRDEPEAAVSPTHTGELRISPELLPVMDEQASVPVTDPGEGGAR